MSKKDSKSIVIAEETTTLPEGARVSVSKVSTTRTYKSGQERVKVTTLLRAYHGDKIIKMPLDDDVSAAILKAYLDLIVKEITRRRWMMSKKPEFAVRPSDVHSFVQAMAFNEMFILNDFTGTKETL